MKTIIAGSRSITDMSIVTDAIAKSGFDITTVISGMASGDPMQAISELQKLQLVKPDTAQLKRGG